jgi:shikimate dehydrogenase
LVDSRTPRAALAGAVNTIEVQAQGVLHGDNTDGVGLVNDIVNNQGGAVANKSVLLLGAGGAARGVLSPLLEQGPADLVIANRTEDRAIALAQTFSKLGAVSGCGFDDLAGRRFDLVINATSASLQGELPHLPELLLAPDAWCYDMMYAATATPFMQWAERHGAAKVSDGLGMLVEQAAESFLLWRKVRPQTAAVIATLRAELQ